jgi:flagellar hook-associated protein 3 FlgL
MMYGTLMSSLQNNLQNLLNLQRQMATQNKYSKLSDNPAAISRSLSLQSSIISNAQYIENQKDAMTILKDSETAMDSLIQTLQTIREKVIYAGDAALDKTAVAAIADEIDALKQSLLDTLNTKIADKYIFGGTDTTTKPFVMGANGQIRYVGSDERIRYQIEEGLLADVSFTGRDVMASEFNSFFVCSHYVPLDWQWKGREEKVQITVGNRTLAVYIPEQWIDEVATGNTKPTDYNEFRDPEEVSGISLDDLATLVNRALTEQGADMLVTATVEKNYSAGQQRLVFKSNTGESISVTGWPDTDYLPMPQSIAGLEMRDSTGVALPNWNHTMLVGSGPVDFNQINTKSLLVYIDNTPVTVDLTGVTDMTDLLSELNTEFTSASVSVLAVEQNGKVALISASGKSLQVDGTAVSAIFGGVNLSSVPKYEGIMGSVNTLGWKGDGLGKQIDIQIGSDPAKTFELDKYKNITELVTAINDTMPIDAGDLPFASIVSGRLVLQSTKGDIKVTDSGTPTGGTAQLFGEDYATAGITSSTSSLTIQLADDSPIKIYINDGDTLDQIADRLNAIEGIYSRTSADGDQLVVVAQRMGNVPEDPLAVDAAAEKLHYPSFNISGEGMALSLFDFSYTLDSATGIETGTAGSKEKTRPVDHSHMDVFDYLSMETALKGREYKEGEVITVAANSELHWRVISGTHVTDIKLNPGTYTMEQLAERLKNAGAGWLEVTVDVFRGEGIPSTDDTETGLGTSLNREDATSRLVIRSTTGAPVGIMDMNEERYAEEVGLSTALRSDENMGMKDIVLPTAPCVDENLAAMVRVQKTCGATYDIRLLRKDVLDSNGNVDRVKVMEQIAKQANAQAGYEFLRVVIPVDANGQKLTNSASLVAVTGEPFEVVDLPFLDPVWSESYTPGVAAQMGIHGGVTSNLKLTKTVSGPGIKDDTKMGATGTIRFESLGHSVEIDVTADDTVKTIMDRLRSQAGDWLYVNYFDAAMGNSAGQEGDYPIVAIAAKDGSPVNVLDVEGTVAETKLLLNTSIQGAATLVSYNSDGTVNAFAGWTVDLRSLPGYPNYDSAYATTPVPPQTFSITVAGYTHTIDLTAMRDSNGNAMLDAADLVETINARMQDYDVKAELNKDGFLVLWSPRGYMIEVEATELGTGTGGADVDIKNKFLGTGTPSTPYRGGYDLENTSRTAPGIFTQNVVTRSGANLTKQNFFGVLDDIGAAVRAENRDGLSDKLLPMIDKFMDSLLKAVSTNGALQARYQNNVTRMSLNEINMTEAHGKLVGSDIDSMTALSSELMMAQAIYEASLGVISYIVQPTLLDFLR